MNAATENGLAGLSFDYLYETLAQMFELRDLLRSIPVSAKVTRKLYEVERALVEIHCELRRRADLAEAVGSAFAARQ